MTVFSKQVELFNKEGKRFDSTLLIKKGNECELVYQGNDSIELIYRDRNLFDCLTKLRKEMESRGVLIACKGSQLNVFPSGMCKQMASGMVAYKLTLGESTVREDIVNIFDPAEPELVVSIEEQKEFYTKWLMSLNS
jgi:hypothetical protein